MPTLKKFVLTYSINLLTDPNWGLMETMSKAINQTAQKLDEEVFPKKQEEGNYSFEGD